MSDDKKIIFSMMGVSKSTPAGKQIVKDISLQFYYGAKIGIIGFNGSGKSTVMKIIAGIDKSFIGDLTILDGYTVGYLPQEPELNPNKTVKEIVSEGVQETVDILKEYEDRSEEHTSELQSRPHLVCRLLLEKKKKKK